MQLVPYNKYFAIYDSVIGQTPAMTDKSYMQYFYQLRETLSFTF